MAARKRSGGSTALVPIESGPPTLPTSWQDRLAGRASKQAAVAGKATGGWPFLSLRNGVVRLGEEKYDTPLRVIILDARFENNLFEEAYDASNPVPPKCWAIGLDEEKLAPPANLETKESDACANCWANAFGSDDRGKGKACKNTRRIAVLPADVLDDPKRLAEEEGVRMRVPVMSLKAWATFTKKITEGFQRPLWSLVTDIDIVPDPKSQFRVTFTPVSWIQDPAALEILERREVEAAGPLEQEPQRQVEDNGGGGRGGQAPRRRKVTRAAADAETPDPAGNPPAVKRKAGGAARKF